MPEILDVISLQEFALCSVVVFLAAILQMSVGMGFGMLASPLLALIRPDLVPGVVMMLGVVVALSGAWRERREISIVELKLGVGGRLIGSAMAFAVLVWINDIRLFMIFFGSMMLIAIIITGLRWRMEFTNARLLNLSVFSGLMGTITAVGAPPMAIIYHERPPHVVRPTLNAFFFSGAVIGLVSLGASGWLSLDELLVTVLMLPAMIVGIIVSGLFIAGSGRWMSSAMLWLSGIASAILILRGLGVFS